MNARDLQNSILHLAIQGKLVEQREEEGTAKELLEKIEAEKKHLLKEKKIKKQKPLASIKEDEIPFDIPESWEWVRIAEIGEIVGGGTPKTGNSEFWSGGDIPWLTPADMKFVEGKYVKNGGRFITDKGLKGSSARLMPKGTIIYSSRAPIGYIAIADNDLATNQGFKSLVPYEISVNEYMYYCLISRTNEIISRASGTTFKEISGSEFGLTIVPLPPLEEQKRIVAKVEELMPYVDKYDKAYSEVEELNKKFPEDMQKSILQYAIQGKLVEQREEEGTAEELYQQIQDEKERLIKEGKIKKTKALPEISEGEIPFDIPENWKWVSLNGISTKITDGEHKTPRRVEKFVGYYLLSARNVLNGEITLEDVDYVDETEFEKISKRCNPQNGDILISCSGSVGRCSVVRDENNYVMVRSAAMVSILGCYPEYIMYAIQSGTVQKQIKNLTKQTAQANLFLGAINQLLIPMPPLEEQKRIVDKLKEVLPKTKKLEV